MNLREIARGRDCQIRMPGICNRNPETTVLAHFRMQTGGALKPDDWQGSWACSACHDAVDGRTKHPEWTRENLRLAHAEGVLRTQAILRKEGVRP